MNGFMSLIESAREWSVWGASLTILAAESALLLAIVVVTINLACRRWLSSGQMGVLWGLVLLRLLVPIAPSAVFSLQNVLPGSQSRIVDLSSADGEGSPQSPIGGPYFAVASPSATTIQTDSSSFGAQTGFDLLLACLPIAWLMGA